MKYTVVTFVPLSSTYFCYYVVIISCSIKYDTHKFQPINRSDLFIYMSPLNHNFNHHRRRCLYGTISTSSSSCNERTSYHPLRQRFALFATASDKVITDATSLSSSSSSSSSSNTYDATTSMDLINQELRRALRRAYPSDYSIHNSSTMLFQGKSEFGDYQCNMAMPLSKVLKQKPRDIAETIMSNVAIDAHDDADSGDGVRSIIQKMDISGPGFINIHLSSHYIKHSLFRMLQPIKHLSKHTHIDDDDDASSSSSSSLSSSRTDEKHLSYNNNRVGIPMVTRPQRIVVDFSSPNIAKEMHVVRGREG